MFKIDQSSNRISRLQSKSFSELGFSERNHLQEWLAYQPDAFGEELLIIQKEFDGYNNENWPEIIRWLVAEMIKFEKALKQPLQNANQKLKEQIKDII